jgi:diguanylate cyclase (GGDEF)-like protein
MNNIIQLEQHLDEAVKVKKRIQSTGTEGLDFDSRISFEMNQMYVKNSEIFKNKDIKEIFKNYEKTIKQKNIELEKKEILLKQKNIELEKKEILLKQKNIELKEKNTTLEEMIEQNGIDSLTGLLTNGIVYGKFKDMMLKSYKELKSYNKLKSYIKLKYNGKLKSNDKLKSDEGLNMLLQINKNIKFNAEFNYVKELKSIISSNHEINYAFIMIDADDFTDGNTQNGHPFMDGVLIDLAKILKNSTRGNDLTARLGGEELAVICKINKIEDAQYKSEQIRKTIDDYNFKDGYKQSVSVGTDIYSFNNNNVKVFDKIFIEYEGKFKNAINSSRKKIEEAKQKTIDNYLLPIFENLRKNSDDATYESKNKGKNLASVYDSKVDYQKHRLEYDSKKKGLSQQELKLNVG